MLKGRGDPISVCSPMHGLVLILLGCMSLNHVEANPLIELSAGSDPKRRDSILFDLVQGRDATVSIEKHKKWRKALPRCAHGKSGLREDWPESGEVSRLRGVLITGFWICTAKQCQNTKCCNYCSSELKFISRTEFIKKGEKGKGMPIILAGNTGPLRHTGMDCAVDSLKKLPFLEVVVSGYMGEEGTLINANICVMGELPRSSKIDQSGKIE